MVAQASVSNEEELIDLSNSEATLRSEQVLATAAMKFTYVVAAQLYGKQKKDNAKQAQGIAYLLKTYKGLRVAYVDEVKSTEGMQYFSVLVKYDQDLEAEVEIFRVQLPGPLKQGEGKPENQNHALIFTRGDAVQTIDMNQVRKLAYSMTWVLECLSESFFNSMGSLCRELALYDSHWLFCTEYQIFLQFMTTWHAKMCWTLNEPILNVLCSNLHSTSKHALQSYQTWKVLYFKQPTPDQKSC